MNGAEKAYLEAGMDDYIAKPIRADELLRKLAQLGSSGANADLHTSLSNSAPPIIDQVQLGALRNVLSSTQLRELIAVFVLDAEEKLESLVAALEADNFESTAGFAHELIGSAGNIGARRLALLLSIIETEAIAHSPNAAVLYADVLREAGAATTLAFRGEAGEVPDADDPDR